MSSLVHYSLLDSTARDLEFLAQSSVFCSTEDLEILDGELNAALGIEDQRQELIMKTSHSLNESIISYQRLLKSIWEHTSSASDG
jgi:hypothetical protein